MIDALTVKDVSRLTGWCEEKVRALIRSGRLQAANTSTGRRPTYTIQKQHLLLLLSQPACRQHKAPKKLKAAEQVF
jgi:hypothetical protein